MCNELIGVATDYDVETTTRNYGTERGEIMIKKSLSSQPGHVRVVFELPSCVWADRIHLAGEFNDWDETSIPMRQGRDGVWRAELDLRRGTSYQFRYVVDGHWQTDYHADGTADNQYGTHNSIVHAELPAPPPEEEFHSSLIRERSGLTNPRTSRPLPPLVKHPVLDPGSVYAGRSHAA